MMFAASVFEFERLCQAVRVLGEASPRALDAISSLGERMSAPLVAAALVAAGIPARVVDAARVVVTDGMHQSASPDMEATAARAETVVVPLADISSTEFVAQSLMPEGFLESMDPNQRRNLVAYLMGAAQAPLPAGK